MTELNQFIIKDIIKDTDEQPDAEVCRRKSGRVLSVAASLPCGYRAQHLLHQIYIHQPRSSNLVIQEFIGLNTTPPTSFPPEVNECRAEIS